MKLKLTPLFKTKKQAYRWLGKKLGTNESKAMELMESHGRQVNESLTVWAERIRDIELLTARKGRKEISQ